MPADRPRIRRPPSRRFVIAGAGCAALGLVAGCDAVVSREVKPSTAADDIALINSVLGLEYAAVAAYDAALASGALGEPDAAMARAFQDDHRKHGEALVRAIGRLQGKAVAARPPSDGRASLQGLTERDDAMRFLVGIEQGLALDYLGAVPAFAEKDLAKGAAGILGIETMHWSAWRRALGENPVPSAFLG